MNPEGYNLVEEGSNLWSIQVIGSITYVGTFTEAVVYAVVKLGFDIEEIEIAVQAMIESGYNVGHFGMNRMFLYSFQYKVPERMAS